MPTILYLTKPIVYLRTKKTGSHSVKAALQKHAIDNSISYLEVRSKDTDTLETHRFVSHMNASDLAERLDVWNQSYKFTFVRNPWESLYSYYYFLKYTGPKYNYNNPDNLSVKNFEEFVNSLIEKTGSCNFNKPIYSIDDNVVADVYDVNDIASVLKTLLGINQVNVLNKQNYTQEVPIFSQSVDNYIYKDYSWEIDKFGYTKPLDQS